MEYSRNLQEARIRLVETGGIASQDFGTGRVVGQVAVYLYLQERECSLDQICEAIGLSKASVSIAVRQLEQLGLARKVWKTGDKKKYYKSAENIASALQQGVISLILQKVHMFGGELERSLMLVQEIPEYSTAKEEAIFLKQRIERARELQRAVEGFLGSPLIKMFGIKQG